MESINVVIDNALVHTNDALDEDYDSDSAYSRDVKTENNQEVPRSQQPTQSVQASRAAPAYMLVQFFYQSGSHALGQQGQRTYGASLRYDISS